MASINLVGQMEEQPSTTKPRIDNAEEQEEIESSNESDLQKSTELKDEPPAKKPRIDEESEEPNGIKADEQKEELETSTTTTVDLPPPRHRKLPAELNQQIFLCFNPATQLKFIGGLNWDFYAMFRYRLLTKTKRVRNPLGNRWNGTDTRATISADGQNVKVSNQIGAANVFAEQSFPISGPLSRMDDFPGTILYYYEVKGRPSIVGLSGAMIYNLASGGYSNSYSIPIIVHHHHCLGCRLAGEPEPHFFELPEGAIRPVKKGYSDVFGCGLVLDPDNKLSIFFTLNGQLLGRKIPISPTVDRLFPAFTMVANESIEANFGDDPAKPFEYDIHNCPGLGLACV